MVSGKANSFLQIKSSRSKVFWGGKSHFWSHETEWLTVKPPSRYRKIAWAKNGTKFPAHRRGARAGVRGFVSQPWVSKTKGESESESESGSGRDRGRMEGG